MRAELSVKQFKEVMASGETRRIDQIKTFITGLAEGMLWANVMLEREKKTALFCEPETPALTVENCIDIIQHELAKPNERTTRAQQDEHPVGLYLMSGLRAAFPCSAK
jgi:hypothetical protein